MVYTQRFCVLGGFMLVNTGYAVNIFVCLDRPTESNFTDFLVSAIN